MYLYYTWFCMLSMGKCSYVVIDKCTRFMSHNFVQNLGIPIKFFILNSHINTMSPHQLQHWRFDIAFFPAVFFALSLSPSKERPWFLFIDKMSEQSAEASPGTSKSQEHRIEHSGIIVQRRRPTSEPRNFCKEWKFVAAQCGVVSATFLSVAKKGTKHTQRINWVPSPP